MSGPELSVGRDNDGDVTLEIFVHHTHQISLSISPNGVISWAARIETGGDPSGTTRMLAMDLGKALYDVINPLVPNE